MNRGFNAMLGNLRQIERDRAVLLAGVSHDLRTPLARLRLGIELGTRDESTHAGMVADIEEMDRIIGQFLDFARDDATTTMQTTDLNAVVAACVERYTQAGQPVTFAPGTIPPLPLKPTAISRLVANLVDNALAYGAPPVEVATTMSGGEVWLDVADRGTGIPADQVERLKQPFTRATAARARDDGAAGAGLGPRDRRAHRAHPWRDIRSEAARRRRHGRARDVPGRALAHDAPRAFRDSILLPGKRPARPSAISCANSA